MLLDNDKSDILGQQDPPLGDFLDHADPDTFVRPPGFTICVAESNWLSCDNQKAGGRRSRRIGFGAETAPVHCRVGTPPSTHGQGDRAE
jgi:hypothetical protein